MTKRKLPEKVQELQDLRFVRSLAVAINSIPLKIYRRNADGKHELLTKEQYQTEIGQ